MNKPKLWVLLRKADGLSVTIRIERVDSYTHEEVSGHAGYYYPPWVDRKKFQKAEQYVFFTENYVIESIDGKRCIGQKEGSCGAVAIMPQNSSAPGENYALLMRTHAWTEGYRTLKGDKKVPWIMVLLGVVVAVVVIVGIMYLRGRISPGEVVPEASIVIERGYDG